MKYLVREEVVQPLTELSWRISEKPEFATLASAYVLLLAVRQGASFPLPDVNVILEREKGLPLYVRAFLESHLASRWPEYRHVMRVCDEESLVDFFSNEATPMLMACRLACAPHPLIDQLCIGLLDVVKGNRVADLNCGFGRLVRTAWFTLWNVGGRDEGISVSGLSRDSELAALAFILCDVTGVGAKIVAQSLFVPCKERYDRLVLIPPFGLEARALNIPQTRQVLSARFADFPELRLSSADWVFAARAASLLAPGGRAVVAVPMSALNGTQGLPYREFLVRNGLIASVISIPGGYLNGTMAGFALILLQEGAREIKFINGEAYEQRDGDCPSLDVVALLKDVRDLNDYEAVTTRTVDEVGGRGYNLTPDFYLGEDLVYNHSRPLEAYVASIRRGAKLPLRAWKAVAGGKSSPVRKVAFRHLGEGLLDEDLPGLTEIPAGGAEAVLEPGDLLISRMGVPFRIAVVDARPYRMVADENVWIVRMGGDKVGAYYLRAYLESARGARWLSRLSTGAVQRTISAKSIAKIPVPDVDDRTRAEIAAELERATTRVRENRRRLGDSLAAMKNVFDTFDTDGGL